jgi:hypothetical protein
MRLNTNIGKRIRGDIWAVDTVHEKSVRTLSRFVQRPRFDSFHEVVPRHRVAVTIEDELQASTAIAGILKTQALKRYKSG